MFFKSLKSLTDERGGPKNASTIARYNFAIAYVKNKTILDIGCGVGEGAHLLKKSHAKNVLAIDYADIAIEYARRNFSLPNVAFKVLDARNIDTLKKKFDVIIAFEILEHLPKKKHSEFIQNISNLLSRKGVCILSTPNRIVYSKGKKKSSNPYHEYEYTQKELRSLCVKHFSSVSIKGIICTSKSHHDQEVEFGSTITSQLIEFVSQFKLTHQLLGLIPQQVKNAVTGRKPLDLTPSDYSLVKTNIDKAGNLLAFLRASKRI